LCFCSVFFVFHRAFLVFHSSSVLGLFVKIPFLVLFLPLFFSPVSGFSSGFSFSSAPPCFRLSPLFLACSSLSVFWVFLLWVLLQFFSLVFGPTNPPLVLFFSSHFSAPCSGFSSPFYREICPSTSPAFAGLLFKSRTGSWARDVVHDLLQISC